MSKSPSRQKIRVATCQFAEDWSPERNGRLIRRFIAKAKSLGADVVHFHECALSGYCGQISSQRYDWQQLRRQAELVATEAARQKVWVIMGSSHPLTPPHRPHNSLYLISPEGKTVDRYDKRFLMPAELEVYTPGDRFVTFQVNGIRCSLLICFDLRFPELYRQLVQLGVRAVFQSFHNGRFDGPGIHEHIMRQTLQAHAACNGLWISAPNSAAPYQRWPSVFIRPDGFIAGQLNRNRGGIMINEIDADFEYYDPISPFRELAIKGVLHNGKCVTDTRSKSTDCF